MEHELNSKPHNHLQKYDVRRSSWHREGRNEIMETTDTERI